LPEALQEGWDGVQGLAGGAAAGGEFVELGDDAALLVEGGKREIQIAEPLRAQVSHTGGPFGDGGEPARVQVVPEHG